MNYKYEIEFGINGDIRLLQKQVNMEYMGSTVLHTFKNLEALLRHLSHTGYDISMNNITTEQYRITYEED